LVKVERTNKKFLTTLLSSAKDEMDRIADFGLFMIRISSGNVRKHLLCHVFLHIRD